MIQLFKSKIFLKQFFSFIFIICFTFISISIIFLTTTHVSLKKQQLITVENYRIDASKQIARWLDSNKYNIKANARYLAEVPQKDLSSLKIQTLLKEQIDWDDNLIDMLILNSEGNIINSITGPMNINLADREYFKEGMNGKSNITGIYPSAKNFLIMAFSEPIIRNGITENIIVGIISIDRVREVVESFKFGDIGHAYLVTDTGMFVSASKVIENFRKRNHLKTDDLYQIHSYAFEELLQKREGTSHYKDFQGENVFGSYQWLEPLQIGLIVEFNQAKAMKPSYEMISIMGVIALIIILTGMLLAYLLSRRLIEPIKLLIDATLKITAKNYQEPLKITTATELDMLVHNFNQMQSAIQSRELQLEKANEELREQRAQAMEANKLKSQFLANMSHELRTPLNSIIGFTTRVIKKTKDLIPQIQLENLYIVNEEAQHLLELINNLLDYSKIEAGKMEIHIEPFNLVKVINEVNSMVNTLIEDKPIIYEQDFFNDTLIPMKSDRMKTKQIMINLLSNAFKYSEQGTVRLSIKRENLFYRIQVQDEGIGIAPEFLESIFDEFRQVDGSYTRKVGGTGLGLSITKRFTEMLGGRIEVNSTEGVGTCFTVLLPIELTKDIPLEVEELSNTNQLNQKKVVCIDDDPNVQRLYKQYLLDYDFEVISLHGWEDILELVREIMPDVILLDIMLPVKDGWEILSELKNDPKTRKIPVIMVSVLSEKNLAYKMRADEYLIKPVTQNEVIDAIERIRIKQEGLEVLVADDDENYLNLISQFLREEDIAFRLARNGDEALKFITQRKPDLLILDIMMPKKDGFSVIAEISNLVDYENLPIIVVTAKDLTNQEKLELRNRAKMVIQKSGSNIETVMQMLIQEIKESNSNGKNSHS